MDQQGDVGNGNGSGILQPPARRDNAAGIGEGGHQGKELRRHSDRLKTKNQRRKGGRPISRTFALRRLMAWYMILCQAFIKGRGGSPYAQENIFVAGDGVYRALVREQAGRDGDRRSEERRVGEEG